MPILRICLFGEFSLRYDDESIAGMDTPRLQALLVYLVLLHQRMPVSRQRLAFLFWPDTAEEQARTNLRNLLHHLRRALPENGVPFLALDDRRSLRWRRRAPFALDVMEFEQLVDAANQHLRHDDAGAAQSALEAAVACYRGDLLPNCGDDWIVPERERLRLCYVGALEQLIRLLEAQHEVDAALRYTRLLLHSNPLQESAYLSLMRLHAQNNDFAGAVRVYHECEKMLKHELNMTPGPELQQLHRSLLARRSAASAEESASELIARWPLVGRHAEWKTLIEAWNAARRGRAHLVLLSGEAGIGKTQLAEELLAWVTSEGATASKAHAYAIGGVAYAPVSDWLRSDPLQRTLTRLDPLWLAEVVRILPELLVTFPHLSAPAPMTESWQRRRFFDALVRAITVGSQPLLLLLDDLQWCDQETLDWLHHLLTTGATTPLLVVGTLRKDLDAAQTLDPFLLNLRRSALMTEVELAALTEHDTARLIQHVARKPVDPGVAARLYRETEGNPLFVVEIVRAELLRDQATADAAASYMMMPSLIRTVIESRLHHLSAAARAVAAVAATIGREFSLAVLTHASDDENATVVAALDELWRRRIVREQGGGYDFSHDKIREVVYVGMSLARRRWLHQRVAHALERVYAVQLDSAAAQIAAHYAQADLAEQAIAFYRRAADAAQRIYAHGEATRLLTTALKLLAATPASAARDEQELGLLSRLSLSLMLTQGYASPAVEECFRRTAGLCARMGRTDQLFAAELGLWVGYLLRARLRDALSLAQQLHDQAAELADARRLCIGHTALGMTCFHLGQQVDALRHLETALARMRATPDLFPADDLYSFLGVHFEVNLLVYNQLVVWLLGDVTAALHMSERALELAQAAGHPYSQDYALGFTAIGRLFRGDTAAAGAQLQMAARLSQEYGFVQWTAHEMILQGRVWVEQGRVDAGIDHMRQGLEGWQATGARLAKSYYLGLLAEGCAAAGRIDEGFAALDAAMAHAEAHHEGWWVAELHRLRGELLRQENQAAAEAAFERSLASATAQKTRSLELRAVTSLARLWQHQGKVADARRRLAECIAGFTTGFDASDLQAANALLAQLSEKS